MGRVDNQSIGFTRETSQEKVICYVREEVFFLFIEIERGVIL